jgi:hypothetical protein
MENTIKPKSARRFFQRNWHRLAKQIYAERIGILWSYKWRRKLKVYLVALRADQNNPASRRVYHKALALINNKN